MNKRQKEVVQHQLTMERLVLDLLEKEYKEALKDINLKIQMYLAMPETQSRIYHRQYQETLKKQVEAALEKLHSDEYDTINKYVHDCYTDAFVGTFYDLHGQGVPVIAPIDQNAAIRAVMTDSKLNKPLYQALGVDVNNLKKVVSSEITRGIAAGLMYEEIARNIQFRTNAPISRAKTIVRTEGHRIQEASAEDARQVAKSKGADVVKMWDATLDGKTRPTHRRLDGQIRETDEYFELGSKKAMHPGEFGDPAEDCNCRCKALTRSRSALDEDELEILRKRAAYHGLLVKDSKEFGKAKAKDFADFKKKYLTATGTLKKQGKSSIIELPKDPFYEGLSKDDIAKRYKKSDGSNLLDKTFMDMALDVQRETVRGYDKAIDMYGENPPQRLKAGKLSKNVFATYSLDFRTITFNETAISDQGQAYATAIHEMTHHAQNVKLINSESVLKSAFKKLGFSAKSKVAVNLKMKTVGSARESDYNQADEIVAYAIERQMTGRTNPLTDAIYSVLKERGVIK